MMDHAPVDGISETSPALFEKLFQFSPDGIVVVAGDGCIHEANPQAQRLFGYSRNELVGRSIETLVPDRVRLVHSHLRSVYQAAPKMRPMGTGLELYGRRKDGSEFPVDILLSPVEMDSKHFVLIIVRDITQRKQMEEHLRKSEEHFHLLIEGARDYAIFMLNPQGQVASWNAGAERIKGYRSEEIIGQHFSRFYLQEDIERGKPEQALEIAKAEGRYEDEGWKVRKDGSRFWADVIITALRGEDGTLLGFAKVTRDFTSRRTAEASLLLELSNVILSSLDIRKMLTAIAAGLHRVVPYDYAAIALYDSNTGNLRVQGVLQGTSYPVAKEILLPIEGTPAGWVFRHRQPLFLARLQSEQFTRESHDHFQRAGIKSGCWVPLNGHDRVMGTLVIGSRRESAFDPKDAGALLQVGREIAVALDNVQALQQMSELTGKLKKEKEYLEEELRTEYSFEEIIGESSGLKRVLKQVETVAPTDATVLIQGETGTGKELIARAIHERSPRCNRTFVKLNCSAIPLGLLESELFGYERGAFTGAITQRVGRFELAHMGTLFLDEIGDLPLELQPKILRALQEKEIERLGGTRTIPVDVRLIAATNRDLTKMVKAGEFRSDLYYRLRVFPITIPPLHQRRGDIPLLVNYFVTKHSRRMNKPVTTIPAEAMAAFMKWRWPGNVRELENFIERAVILTQGTVLRAPLAELEDPEDSTPRAEETLEVTERTHILRVLHETKGRIGGVGGAAKRLGLKRTTLNSKLRRLGIAREDYR